MKTYRTSPVNKISGLTKVVLVSTVGIIQVACSGEPTNNPNLTISSDGTQAHLTWSPVDNSPVMGDEYSGFLVHYGKASLVYDHLIDVGFAVAVTISDLDKGETYYFAVSAYNSGGRGPISNEVSKQIP